MKPILAASFIVTCLLGFSPVLPAKDARKDGTPHSIEHQILGFWAIDQEKTREAMKRAALKAQGKEKLDEDELEEIEEMVESMASSGIIEFKTNGVATSHEPEGPEDGSYKILNANNLGGTFTLTVKPEDVEENSAECSIAGDHLVFTLEEDHLEAHLKRLTPLEAKARIAEMQKAAKEDK